MALDIDISQDAADLMSQVCEIQRKTAVKGGRKAEREDWTTERSAVPCLILPADSGIGLRADRRVGERATTVYFDSAVTLGPNRRIVFTDGQGVVKYLYPEPEVDVAGLGQLWTADCEETPEP